MLTQEHDLIWTRDGYTVGATSGRNILMKNGKVTLFLEASVKHRKRNVTVTEDQTNFLTRLNLAAETLPDNNSLSRSLDSVQSEAFFFSFFFTHGRRMKLPELEVEALRDAAVASTL